MGRREALLGPVLVACLVQAGASERGRVDGAVSPAPAAAATTQALRLEQLGALDAALAISLPPPSQQQQAAVSDGSDDGPLRIGFHRDLPTEYQGDLAPRLRFVTDPDGGMIAAVTVTSPGAVRVRLAFRAVSLPTGAQIRFFGGTPPRVIHTFDSNDLSAAAADSGLFWSPSVPGPTIGLEIALPSPDGRDDVMVVIDRVSHQFRPLGAPSAPVSKDAEVPKQSRSDLQCGHVDIQCRDVGTIANAVAQIAYEKARGRYTCSGTLMNDTDRESFIPYFLTAHHCVSTREAAQSMETLWFYQAATCRAAQVDSRSQWTYGGADLLAKREAQDATLLRLRGRVPAGLFYSGWDSSWVEPGRRVYGIHHPGGRPKKYVAGRTEAYTDASICADPENQVGCFVVRHAIPLTATDGATEGGSSGSGLFWGEGYLVGVLSGGPPDDCTKVFYGRFGDFYPVVRGWLNPQISRVGTVQIQPTSMQVPEGGDATYAVRLGLRPTASVTIFAAISGDRDLSVRPASVAFTSADWDAWQRFTVYAAEDTDRANGNAVIDHRVSSLDAAYDGIRAAAVSVREKDNDRRAGSVTGVSVRATEEAGEIEIQWNAVAGADTYIVEWRQPHEGFARARRSIVPGTVTSITLTNLNGDTAYIVRVTARQDGLLDGRPSGLVAVVTSADPRPFFRGWRLLLPTLRSEDPRESPSG